MILAQKQTFVVLLTQLANKVKSKLKLSEKSIPIGTRI
jgi:hypothetical protein